MFRSRVRSKSAMAITASIVVATIAVVGMQVALAASPVPVVVSFTATKTTIPDTGARIVLKASIKYASSCEITVSPSLPGFPKSFSCSSDRVMQSVTLRANKTGNPITYSFGMAVKNSTGSITATNVAVTEDAALPIPVPVVVSFTATKTTIPDTGARIVLKASIKYRVVLRDHCLTKPAGIPEVLLLLLRSRDAIGHIARQQDWKADYLHLRDGREELDGQHYGDERRRN